MPPNMSTFRIESTVYTEFTFDTRNAIGLYQKSDDAAEKAYGALPEPVLVSSGVASARSPAAVAAGAVAVDADDGAALNSSLANGNAAAEADDETALNSGLVIGDAAADVLGEAALNSGVANGHAAAAAGAEAASSSVLGPDSAETEYDPLPDDAKCPPAPRKKSLELPSTPADTPTSTPPDVTSPLHDKVSAEDQGLSGTLLQQRLLEVLEFSMATSMAMRSDDTHVSTYSPEQDSFGNGRIAQASGYFPPVSTPVGNDTLPVDLTDIDYRQPSLPPTPAFTVFWAVEEGKLGDPEAADSLTMDIMNTPELTPPATPSNDGPTTAADHTANDAAEPHAAADPPVGTDNQADEAE